MGQTQQLTVTANYPDNSTKDLTAAPLGTNYTTTNPAIATISPAGLVTAVSSGTALIQASNDGATGILAIHILIGGASVSGIPVSWAIANGLDPTDPNLAAEDPDRDGLTNLQEFNLGTNPMNPDTDGDGLTDGDEVNKYKTNPLLADTDGDLIPDGVEITTGTNPLDPKSYDLAKATATSTVAPPSFTLTTSTLNPLVSALITWNVTLIDGKTTLNLTADPRTVYTTSNATVCTLSPQAGRIFAGNAGTCTITISQNTLSVRAAGTVSTFTPTALSFLTMPGFANNVKPSGDYAYVAAGSAGLQVVDVTDRTKPKIVTSLALSSNANNLRIAGNTLYMCANTGLLTIDITNPLTPTLLGSLSTPDVAWDVVIAGTTAYIAAGSSGLQIANVANPASPALIRTLAIAGGTAKGVDVNGNLAVVAASGAGVVIVDVTNPASPARLGAVATPGDARKVAVSGSAAFIADYPVSMEVVDFSNPSVPQIVATTTDALGGKLQDVTLASVAGFTYTLGADVYFVNGVPIVDVTTPSNPNPRAILNFAGYRDDNGHGIGADRSYVYMTGEEGTVTDLGTTGDTRLYIGQYQQIVDTGGIPPTIQITSPASEASLIQGQTVTISASATDDIAVASVTLLVNGQPVFTATAPPYQFSYKVPVTATSLTFGGTAVDFGNNAGTAANVVVPVAPDPGTTVTGKVVDANGNPVSRANVITSVGGVSSTTGADGTFSIAQAPTVQGNIQVTATAVNSGGATLAGLSLALAPVSGGITNVGTITVFPVPVITQLSRKSALEGDQISLQVTGTTLNGATTFAFQPTSAAIGVVIASAAADGTSATLTLTIPAANSAGTFALVATNVAGSSGTVITASNRFTIVDPNSTADRDGDGFQDVIEAVFGTDPLDPNSFPVIPSQTETESVSFSLLNAPINNSGLQETESVSFSLLNAPVTGAGISETESVSFSLLNAPITGAGITETESVSFSVLNSPASGGGLTETESVSFSVLNAPSGVGGITETSALFGVLNNFAGHARPSPPITGTGHNPEATTPVSVLPIDPLADSDGDGLPDWLELLMGTDPQNPDTDGDGLTDFDELFIYRTNPLNADTDGDGFTDGMEILFGSDPLDPSSTPLYKRPRGTPARSNEPKGNPNEQLQKPGQRKGARLVLIFRHAGLLLPLRGTAGRYLQ